VIDRRYELRTGCCSSSRSGSRRPTPTSLRTSTHRDLCGRAPDTQRGRSATCLLWWRWGDSNSGPPPEVVPGGGCADALTCGSLAPVVTAGVVALSYLPARRVPPCTGGLRSRPVSDAFGAPVLRDQELKNRKAPPALAGGAQLASRTALSEDGYDAGVRTPVAVPNRWKVPSGKVSVTSKLQVTRSP
jgi:hypothetical protein